MNKKTPNSNSIFALILIFVVLLAGIIFLLANKETLNQSLPAQSPSPTVRPGVPHRLIIPKLNINAQVENVGLNEKKAMDVPSTNWTVGWYDLGYRPGEVGNAVMAGHWDDDRGGPAVFFHLKKLKVGDEVISEEILPDGKAKQWRYQVALIETYPYDKVPMQHVFGDFPIARLNLITCGGKWDNDTKNYSERTVVYTRLSDNQ
jgi:sortase A